MSEKIDEAMELAQEIKDEAYEFASDPWSGSSAFYVSTAADLLRPILAERDALRHRSGVLEAELSSCIGWMATYAVGPGINDRLQAARATLAASPSPDSAQGAKL